MTTAERLIRAVHERLTSGRLQGGLSWTREPSIRGYGIARRQTLSTTCHELALVVYVDRKRSRSRISVPVPTRLRDAAMGVEVELDVVPVGHPRLNSGRIVRGGEAVGHERGDAGTSTCFVRDKTPGGSIMLLSAAHVLTAWGVASPGDAVLMPPGTLGGEAETDTIARFERMVPLRFTAEGYVNRVDAAVATLEPGAGADVEIPLLGRPQEVTRPQIGGAVRMVGAASGPLEGIVQDVDCMLAFDYRRPDGTWSRAGFRKLIRCDQMASRGGDSGALLVDDEGRAIGIHMAGDGQDAYSSRIDFALDELGVDLYRPDQPVPGGPT